MNILVILGHPDPNSFNHAIARVAVDELDRLGHQVIFHDLYAESFDSVLPAGEISKTAPLPAPIARHCAELAQADGVIIVHPNWWGMPPAVLKGWIDRVVRCGVAYEFQEGDDGEGVPVRLLTRLKSVVVFNTGNTPMDRELAAFGDPLQRIWRDCVFGLCSSASFYRRYFNVVCLSSESERQGWLNDVKTMMRDVFPAECAGSARVLNPVSDSEVCIDAMKPEDWEDVRRIFSEGMATGLASFEVTVPDWETWDRAHLAHCRLVARIGGRVAAWAALTSSSNRDCYAGVAEASLYVGVEDRGKGLGKKLLLALIEESERNGIWTLYGATFAENQTSLRLQAACGFRVIGIRERIAKRDGVWRNIVFTERRSRVVGV